jgi:ABC-2 type transport system ATP-binding protein
MEEPDMALRLQGLTKYYGSQRGIEDLTLDVRIGEVFGFLGPNGAGKTTTIRMILGLLRPTRGHGDVLGLDIVRDSVQLRAQVGYLPGDLALYDRMQGRDLLEFVGRMRGGVPAAQYENLADRMQLDLGRRIKDLSRGNRQKIGVIAAFMHSPRLLVLDEPTSGLDPVVQQEFHRLVRETVEAGATVFLSSHVLAEVEEMADRVGIVVSGRLAVVDSVDMLRERATRRIELDFPAAPPAQLADVPGVQRVDVRAGTATCWVSGEAGPLLKVAVDHSVLDVHTHDPDLEDAFLGYVTGGEQS